MAAGAERPTARRLIRWGRASRRAAVATPCLLPTRDNGGLNAHPCRPQGTTMYVRDSPPLPKGGHRRLTRAESGDRPMRVKRNVLQVSQFPIVAKQTRSIQ